MALNQNLGGLSFYEDATGKYVIGADSVPKKLGNTIYKLGTISNGSVLNINLSSYAGYKSFTVDNVLVNVRNFSVGVSSNGVNKYPPGGSFSASTSITYDSNIGLLNVHIPKIYKTSYDGNGGSTDHSPAVTQGQVTADVFLIA